MTKQNAAPDRLDPEFFERLFEGAGLAVFACDREARILAWNPIAEQLFRRQHGDLAGRDLRDVLPREHRCDLDERLSTLRETLQPLEFRTRISGENGEVSEYAAWLTPIFDERKRLECVCVWFHDITARLQARRMVRTRERLTTLGALAGSVSHHYNNLLCSITTSLEFALNMNTMAAMRRVLRRTADAVARATQLTQQLLVFAQADHRDCDLADLTETVLRYFDQHEAEFTARGLKLELNWNQIPFVPLPRDPFTIVLDNLARNATEAMPDGGTLSVSLGRRDEGSVVLGIGDTGPGIPPEDMDHLFEPFFTTKGELGAGGSRQAGMGLAVVHGLVSEMHGTITAFNQPSGGARFEVILPLDPTR